MEIFKQIFLMILKQIIEAISGSLSTASTKVDAALTETVAEFPRKSKNNPDQKVS